MNNVIFAIFGPDYVVSAYENLGTFNVSNQQVAVKYQTAVDVWSDVLPPGGYMLKYVGGQYFNLASKKYAVTLRVKWQSVDSEGATTIEYPSLGDFEDIPKLNEIYLKANPMTSYVWVEFTKPHRMWLVPSADVIGQASFQVVRHVPRHLMHISYPALKKLGNNSQQFEMAVRAIKNQC